jgi:hypothetical protein
MLHPYAVAPFRLVAGIGKRPCRGILDGFLLNPFVKLSQTRLI